VGLLAMQSVNMKRIIENIIFIIFITHIGFFAQSYAGEKDIFKLLNNGKISVNISNLPLNEALRKLSAKFSIELKGYAVGNELVDLNISGITLDDMLKRMMRGYNYVLIKPENSQKSILMVLGRAERTKYMDTPSVTGAEAHPSSNMDTYQVQQPAAATVPQHKPNSPGNPQTANTPAEIPSADTASQTQNKVNTKTGVER
jgi:hypothetical protein